MADPTRKLSRSADIANKVTRVAQKRGQIAEKQFTERVRKALSAGAPPWELMGGWPAYLVDSVQRTVLFWDTLRQRGNDFLERNRAGLPPVLHFDYEMLVDGRQFERAVNYALVRIKPPPGVKVDKKLRPYVVIDPRAGHGPGIGGFKDDSQVGEALRAGHPVYFVIFFPEPEPGQTMLDVCAAEQQFVRHVRELHPDSPKPAIVGNCQGGWAAMMLAASDPDDTGPIVINGAPMSYWGGAWSEGEGDNPMRYAGGLLGGTWLASLTSDLGEGKFDGAWLVQNFENLNPANTFWDKYYHVYANADTEPPRFLDFERWWSGFYLMNREEIEWITQNLFVGNKLWTGGVKTGEGGVFDIRELKVPVILFASMGDNITPPQQAFNWVGDVYGSTEEIKARGQVIIGLLHEDVGHLGIFVSGRVARKEHKEIVQVMDFIEDLPPGLYGMEIHEQKVNGKPAYDVRFVERRLEDLLPRLNRMKREDEKPFEAVAAISEFNQRAYELFARPLVQAMATDYSAKLGRDFHPLRFQRWAISDVNPFLWWLPAAAQTVKEHRQALPAEHPWRKREAMMSELTSASLDASRAARDAMSEAAFFQIYGNLYSMYLADKKAEQAPVEAAQDPRALPFVQAALAAIDQGGYAEAVARAAFLLARKGEPLPLERLQLKHELLNDYKDLLPAQPKDEARRIRGEQELIVRFEPQRAVETLPALLPKASDRQRFLTLLDKVLSDKRVQGIQPSPEQAAMLERLRSVVGTTKNGKASTGNGEPRRTKAPPRRRTPAALAAPRRLQ
jgi:pimeloyl-ACP methyl ester carboxylesterase